MGHSPRAGHRRAQAVIVAVSVVATAGCVSTHAGSRCATTAFAHDRTHVLRCVHGRWTRFVTTGEAARWFAAKWNGTPSTTGPTTTTVPTSTTVVSAPIAPSTSLVSVTPAGAPGNGLSVAGGVTPDGRLVAFSSLATDLVAGDTNGRIDAFVRDRVAGVTSRVSVATDGGNANGDTATGGISDDGRYVVLQSDSSNLVPGDTNGHADVFVRDLLANTTTLVSTAAGGGASDGSSIDARISADGHFVVFQSDATDLVPDDTNSAPDIFVRDLEAGSTTRVSVAVDGSQLPTGGEDSKAISADGRYVVFATPDSGGPNRVLLRDLQTATTTEVGLADDGSAPNGDVGIDPNSEGVGLSGDGRRVVFAADATNLVPDDTDGATDVFVRDVPEARTLRVSVRSDGSQGSTSRRDVGSAPVITGDGRTVAFAGHGTDLVAGAAGPSDIYVHDLTTVSTRVVSISTGGTRANSESGMPVISRDARFVAFVSMATNLVPAALNGTDAQVFLRDRGV